MTELIKKELFLVAQFSALALLACLWAFVATFFPDSGEHINVREAWKNVEPFVGRVLLAFLALGAARLAIVLAAARLRLPPE